MHLFGCGAWKLPCENFGTDAWQNRYSDRGRLAYLWAAFGQFKVGELRQYKTPCYRGKRDNVEKIRLENSYYTRPKKIEDLYILNLKSKIFENDALIYTNIDSISLKSKKEENYIKVSFKDFPLVGIWTPYYKETNTTAPFLCIEPWYGIADNIDSDKIYQNKKYINKLNVGETFVASYDIEII